MELHLFKPKREGDKNIEEGVQALIEAGADVNASPSRTPLVCAERVNNEEVARLLIEAGAEG